ncbi:MAG: M67 family metallopeptidase [Methylococcales bacterium]|nr:M67 family metallopeptidase [Methylococcales bacterium]
MTPEEIQIPRKITNQLLHLAQQSPDFEICGLIGGKNGFATHCYPIKNTAEQPRQRFLLDAAQQISTMAKMRELGEDLFAIYHSHPSAPAQPSSADLELAAYPDVLYLIISLNTKGILEMRGFKIDQNTAVEIPLILSDDESSELKKYTRKH